MPPDSATATLEELRVLEALQQAPDLSQRELARRIGLSLSKAHFVLKRLMEKGLVKVNNVRESRHKLGYLYVLTPTGLEAKARLTYAFMQRTAEQYQQMVGRVQSRLEEALAGLEPQPETALAVVVGDGALSEVVRDVLRVHGCTVVEEAAAANLAVIVDPEVALDGCEHLPKLELA